MTIRPMTSPEAMYCYSQSQQIRSMTGNIGYLRVDMDTSGYGFFSTWNDFRDDLKTQEFKDELDTVINGLRFGNESESFLKDRTTLAKYCYAHPDSRINDREFGIRVDTQYYTYMMRLNPNRGEYNLYCYCYRRDWLTQHLKQAERGIRFITPHYKEIFRIDDGDKIRIITSAGERVDRTVRYIDDYHVEIGGGHGTNLYHICEFAEHIENLGYKVIPLRSSLPEKCYVYVESENVIGLVERGEKGYIPSDEKATESMSKKESADYLNNEMGVSRAQAAAMNAGSIFGWDVKAADPAYYDDQGKLQQTQVIDRFGAR